MNKKSIPTEFLKGLGVLALVASNIYFITKNNSGESENNNLKNTIETLTAQHQADSSQHINDAKIHKADSIKYRRHMSVMTNDVMRWEDRYNIVHGKLHTFDSTVHAWNKNKTISDAQLKAAHGAVKAKGDAIKAENEQFGKLKIELHLSPSPLLPVPKTAQPKKKKERTIYSFT